MPESRTAREICESVLTPVMIKEIWSINYADAFPFTLQDFAVGAIVPAMLYMFRRAHRRGKGHFFETYAPLDGEVIGKKQSKHLIPSVTSVARVLLADTKRFSGFDLPLGNHVLADMLLCYCVENQLRESGRTMPLIRAFPTHYMSSWVDLPKNVTGLRFVPEALVALLAEQSSGDAIHASEAGDSWFHVGSGFKNNILVNVLSSGMVEGVQDKNLHENFDESATLGVDQLLTVRMAMRLGAAPAKLAEASLFSKGPNIPNRHPIAHLAAKILREDIRLFLLAYGGVIPRQCLLQMLESCVSVGITNVFLATAAMLFEWEPAGRLPLSDRPWLLFADCSNGCDRELQRLAEESLEDCERRIRRLPTVLMALRIAEHKSRLRFGKLLPPSQPDATARINMLGDVVNGRHPQSDTLMGNLSESCSLVREQLVEETGFDDAIAILDAEEAYPNPVWRLAEVVSLVMGEKQQAQELVSCLRSCLMVNETNGLALERRKQFSVARKGRMSGLVRQLVLSNTMLDFLVHRHLRRPGKKGATSANPLSFSEFVNILRERYGLCVDQSPPGQSISMELLLRNRRMLEGRLRDLGLLVGVNDAESMKRLRPRFEARDVEVQHAGRE